MLPIILDKKVVIFGFLRSKSMGKVTYTYEIQKFPIMNKSREDANTHAFISKALCENCYTFI